jgi:glutathione S-transferase
VLEEVLVGKSWLVGDKMTFADLAFVPWNDRLDAVLMCEADKMFDGFPLVKAWHKRMTSRASWKKAMGLRAKLMDEQGLTWNGMPKGVENMEEYIKLINSGAETAAS